MLETERQTVKHITQKYVLKIIYEHGVTPVDGQLETLNISKEH